MLGLCRPIRDVQEAQVEQQAQNAKATQIA